MAFAQSMKKGQIPIGCQLCESGSKIEWKCIDCDLLMCSKCKDKVHSKFKNAVDHKIIGIQEVGQFEQITETLKFSDLTCKQHEGQACCMFCKTCKHLICLKCISKIHNGHDFVDQDEYGVERSKLRDGQKTAQKNYDELSDKEKELDQLKTTKSADYKRAKEEILAQKNAMKNAADQYAEKFINELDQKWKNVAQSIDGQKTKIGLAKKQIEEQMVSADKILNSNDFSTFFQIYEKIGTTLQRKAPLTLQPVIGMPKFMPRKITESTFGELYNEELGNSTRNIQMKVLNCYIIETDCIHLIEVCPDHSIWIGDNYSEKLYHVNVVADRIQVLAKLNIKVFCIAMTPCNDLLLKTHNQSTLKKIINGTIDLVNTSFRVYPLLITSIHITIDNKVYLGARGGEKPFPATGKRVIIVMDIDGNHKAEYENDKDNKPIFTFCAAITSTTDGNIGVVDRLNSEQHGRVIILCPQGEVINIYNGNNEIKKENPFSPTSIRTTQSLNNIIICEWYSHMLHIITSDGQPMACYDTRNIGIQYPFALAISSTGQLFIGCNARKTNSQKLYELEFQGF